MKTDTKSVLKWNRALCAVRMGCGFLETRPQKAAVQFLSQMARSVSCLWIILVALHSCIAANLVVSSWAYLLSVHVVFWTSSSGVSRVMGTVGKRCVGSHLYWFEKTERKEF